LALVALGFALSSEDAAARSATLGYLPERCLRLLGPERQMLQIVQERCLPLLLQAGRRHDLEEVVIRTG